MQFDTDVHVPPPRGWILIMSLRRLLAPSSPACQLNAGLFLPVPLWMSSLGVMKAPYYMPHLLVINYRCYLNTRCCQCAVRFSALTSDGYLGLFCHQAKIVSGDRCLLFKKPSATLSSAAIIARLAGACHYSALLNVKGGASCPAGCLSVLAQRTVCVSVRPLVLLSNQICGPVLMCSDVREFATYIQDLLSYGWNLCNNQKASLRIDLELRAVRR